MAMGLVAGFLTTVSFIPQLIKGFRTGKMDDVSISMPVLLSLGMGLWMLYGIGVDSIPVIIWNAVGLSLNVIMIGLKVHYGRRSHPSK
ncbi:MAG: PQ loop repeat protein [Methanomassiliicoccales archaeon PtaU1.Bin124]|nr:MAG: PQ loop repeat protein [Methanomassiliicoccales archaeon PtaU1.Bin124]